MALRESRGMVERSGRSDYGFESRDVQDCCLQSKELEFPVLG